MNERKACEMKGKGGGSAWARAREREREGERVVGASKKDCRATGRGKASRKFLVLFRGITQPWLLVLSYLAARIPYVWPYVYIHAQSPLWADSRSVRAHPSKRVMRNEMPKERQREGGEGEREREREREREAESETRKLISSPTSVRLLWLEPLSIMQSSLPYTYTPAYIYKDGWITESPVYWLNKIGLLLSSIL